jgi:hypothetical protein
VITGFLGSAEREHGREISSEDQAKIIPELMRVIRAGQEYGKSDPTQ